MPVSNKPLPTVPTWADHVAEWGECRKCPLCEQRDRICLARGTIPCDVLFIGEAPGMTEDAVGQPFVGPAGVLLDQIIERAVPHPDASTMEMLGLSDDTPWWMALDAAKENGLVSDDTFWLTHALTNLVCCFPRDAKTTNDHQPKPSEIHACEPRLVQFVNIARPRLVVCVGRLAAEWIDRSDSIQCVDIDHPAHILRMPLAQRQMATQRCIVKVRNAIEDVLYSGRHFTKWENGGHANLTTRQRIRTQYNEDDLPF